MSLKHEQTIRDLFKELKLDEDKMIKEVGHSIDIEIENCLKNGLKKETIIDIIKQSYERLM